jgi:hypothetical protein
MYPDAWRLVYQTLVCVDELNYVQIKPKQHIAYCICTKHREKEFSECCLSFDGTIVINASFVKKLGMFFDRTFIMHAKTSKCNYKVMLLSNSEYRT